MKKGTGKSPAHVGRVYYSILRDNKQLTIPHQVCEALNLQEGSKLIFAVIGENLILVTHLSPKKEALIIRMLVNVSQQTITDRLSKMGSVVEGEDPLNDIPDVPL